MAKLVVTNQVGQLESDREKVCPITLQVLASPVQTLSMGFAPDGGNVLVYQVTE